MAQAKQTDSSAIPSRGGAQRRLGRWTMGAVVALSAAVGMAAWAHGGADGRGKHGGHGMQGAHGGAAGFAPGLFAGSPERIERRVDRLLGGIDASAEQRAQIKQIATAAASDLRGQQQAGRELRERQWQLFSAPVVDANGVEQWRQQMLSQHDQMSRRTLQAMLDVSRVLSPEQRAALALRAKDRMSRHGKPADAPRPAP